MKYIVIIKDNGDIARLECETLEEAVLLKQAFLNHGVYQSVTIESVK
jgi:hypothetical protein